MGFENLKELGATLETRQILRFGSFRVDLEGRKIWKGEHLTSLTPKVFQTFAVLLQNRNRVVSKKELLDTIWPDTFVDEANLTQNISVLRKALAEPNSETQYIVTFPGRGYRFLADVEEEGRVEAPVAAVEFDPIPNPPPRSPRWRWVSVATLLLAAAGGLLAVRFGQGTQPALVIGSGRIVTHLPGREYQPAISPDGSRIAFVHHRDFESVLSVQALDLRRDSAPRTVSAADGDAFSPAWSPDGRSLAYLQARGNKLLVVAQPVDGPPREVADVFAERYGVVARQLDWSPDGRFLAVSNKAAGDEPFRIDLINLAEGRKTPLTTPPVLSDGDFEPRFSPDGTKLAFVRAGSKFMMEAFIVDMPGGDPVCVSETGQRLGGMDWTPDSKALLLSAERAGQWRLWRVPIGGGKQWESTSSSSDASMQLAVSRGSGRIVLASADPDLNIWRAHFNTPRGAATWERAVSSPHNDSFPVYAPDGRRFVFLSDRSGDSQLWIKEESGERQLTFGALKPGYASWTAKDDEIVFPSLRDRKLYRMRVNGGGAPARVPVDGTIGGHTAVSPDGESVFFVRRFYIYEARVADGKSRLLTDQGGFPLRLSPDGEWVYYVRHRFSNEIWRVQRSTGKAARVVDRLQPGCWACWSVNGEELVYVAGSQPGERSRLELLNLASGRVRTLGETPGRVPPLGQGMLSLAPDEQSLLAVVAEPGAGDLRLVEPLR